MSALDEVDVESLVADASQIYVGVAAKHGPHVTPELFAASGGRLWCMTAAVTVKAKVLAHDDRIAFLTTQDNFHVAGIGRAFLFDPAKPFSIASGIASLAHSPLGAARFVARNLEELAGAARDALAGRLGGPIPPHRVMVAIQPSALAVVADGKVTGSWGWPAPIAVPMTGGSPESAARNAHVIDDVIDRADLPDVLARLAADGTAALGWLTTGGHPLVLPAWWDRAASTATVDRDLWIRCGASPRSAGSVTRDAWTGYGPSGKQGVLLRGPANAVEGGEDARIDLAVDRVTYWDGVETATASG